jgi:hypothetical protein
LESDPVTSVEFLVDEWRAGNLSKDGIQILLSTLKDNRDYQEDHLEARLKEEVNALSDLVDLAYRGVRPDEDVSLSGVIGKRERAQEMRRVLVRWLGEVDLVEAQEALQDLAWTRHAAPHRDFLLTKADQIHDRIATRRDAEVESELQELIESYGTEFDENLEELEIQFVPRTLIGNGTLRRLFEQVQDEIRVCPDLEGIYERYFYKWMGLTLRFLKSRRDLTRGNLPDRCEYLFPWNDDENGPDEFDLQDDYRDFLEGSGIASHMEVEVSDVGGGRADIYGPIRVKTVTPAS